MAAIDRPADETSDLRDLRERLWASIDNDDSRDLDQITVAESLKYDLLEQATKRFALEGIAFPLPQMTVVLKNDRHSKGKQEKERTE